MSGRTKAWVIAASSLALLGCIIFVIVMSVLGWDFKKLSGDKYETNKYSFNEAFDEILIETKTADITFLPSEDSTCYVECYETKNLKHIAKVKDGALGIELVDSRKWYEHIGINFGTPKVSVYLPENEYDKLNINSSTGDIEISKDFKFEVIDIRESTGDVRVFASASKLVRIEASTGAVFLSESSLCAVDISVTTGKVELSDINCEGDISIDVSTGEVQLKNINCKSLDSEGDTGDITLINVIAKNKFSIERSTGDVKFESSDAEEISVETDTGDIVGSLLSEKIFIVETDTGKRDVPKTQSGGICELESDTGDIIIKIN